MKTMRQAARASCRPAVSCNPKVRSQRDEPGAVGASKAVTRWVSSPAAVG